jgi:hypothetical protein
MKDIIKMNKLAGLITESQARRMMKILNESMEKEELVNKIKNLGDFGLTGDEIEFNGLLITASTQEDEGGPYYFVYGEDDDSEDGIFQSTNPNKIAEFVLNY